MSVLEFLASIVSSLAWPAAVFGLVFVLKAPLSSLLNRIISAKGYGVEVDFERAAEKVRANAAAAVDEVEPQSADGSDAPEAIMVLPDVDPTYTVISAWTRVEEAVRALATDNGIVGADRPHVSTLELTRLLLGHGVVNEPYLRSVTGLNTLRNRVAHGQKRTSYDDAVSFARAANELIRATEIFSLISQPRDDQKQAPPSAATGGVAQP